MAALSLAVETVPERHYTHHEERGETPNRSNPKYVHRELAALDVGEGMRVVEIGTGSGYSGGLLSELVGAQGQVVSLDVDAYLSRWANVIHHERGLENVRCLTADGTTGLPDGPFDRMVAWCTPPLLPDAWVETLTEGSVIVAPLPTAELPQMTVVAKIRVREGEPTVEAIFHGGYIETASTQRSDFLVPLRWVDWEYRMPGSVWISVAWRGQDDLRHSGARGGLDALLGGGYQEEYASSVDWASWRAWCARGSDPQLSMVSLTPDLMALGHATGESAAVLQQDGMIFADSPQSLSLGVLRGWLAEWEDAGRPAPESYVPELVRCAGGWRLRLLRG